MMHHKHRVVVQLTDIETDDDRDSSPVLLRPINTPGRRISVGFTPSSRLNKMEVLNNHTLQLIVKNPHNSQLRINRQLQFDAVNTSSDLNTCAELSTLMDLLLVQHHNCCVVRVTALRELHLPFLCNLLVTEVDKRQQLLHSHVHSIKLEYFDVRKYDVVSLLDQRMPHFGPRYRPNVRPRSLFNNSLELLKWLQSEFVQLWHQGIGHECIDLQFTTTDEQHRVHKTKFTLLLLYLSKMDRDTKSGLRIFLQNLGSERRIKHSMLTDCLKEYFNGEIPWRTCLIFDVPMVNGGNLATDEMLVLANAAYAGVNAMAEQQSGVDLQLESSISLGQAQQHVKGEGKTAEEAMPPHECPTALRTDKTRSMRTLTRKKGGAEVVTPNTAAGTAKRTDSCTSKDYKSLSYWYCKMDEKYSNVVSAMEAYYDHRYDERISKLCGDIKQMMRTIDQGNAAEVLDDEQQIKERQLSQHYQQYKLAVLSFRQLVKEIERSTYGDMLKVYVKTKTYELTQHALQVKMGQLESCQSRVAGAIKDEVTQLSSIKKANKKSINPMLEE